MDKILKKLQELDHQKKTVVLIILSGISILFVFYIWLMYFNFMLSKYKNYEVANNENDNVSFSMKLKSGLAFVYENLSSKIKDVANTLNNFINGPQEYNIK